MAKSLAVNSLLVYGQRLSTALITFFATPIILSNLGVEDYGIYTLTIGLIATFNVFSWSLSSASQRFIAVSIGSGDQERLKEVFANGFYIHLGYGLVLLLVISSLGIWFTDVALNIPENKLDTASKVLLIVGFVSFFEMLLIPFQGLLRAYEEFQAIAIIGISRSLLKLLSAYLLFISPISKLVFFALLTGSFTFLVVLICALYVLKRYSNLSLAPEFLRRSVLNELFGFMGWNLIGSVALMGRNQGLAVVINLFFGLVANAAYGIAVQIQAAVSTLSQGIVTVLSPRIMKTAGRGDLEKMVQYANATSKFGILSIATLAIPLVLNMPYVLDWWLDVVPQDTVIFGRLIILFILTTGLSAGIQSIFLAINKVREYHTYVSIIILLNIPIGVLFFWLGSPSYSILLVSIILELMAFLVRVRLLKKHLSFFNMNTYFLNTVTALVFPLVAAFSLGLLMLKVSSGFPLGSLVLSSMASFTTLVAMAYKFSLDEFEKGKVLTFLENVKKRS